MHKELLRRFEAFDIITIAYVIVSGIIMLFGSFKLENIQTRLLIRIAIVAIVVFMALIMHNKNNPFLRALRYFYFIPLILYFNVEGDYINNIFFPDMDRYMANFEITLFTVHPGVALSNIFHFKWVSEFMAFVYLNYYALFIYFLVSIYLKNSKLFSYVAFLISMTIYLLCFIFMLCPVAGPQDYLVPPDNHIPDGYLLRNITHWLVFRLEIPASTFPSTSSLILCFITYLVYKNMKPLFKFVLPLVIMVLISTIYLKLNYTIDVIAGLLSFPAIYWLSSHTYSWINNILEGNVNSISDFFSSIPRMYGKN